jgi:PEP-CTERM motif
MKPHCKNIKRMVNVIEGAVLALSACIANAAIVVTPTINSATLATALGGSGLTITSVNTTNGAASQFGTYTNFNLGPVTTGNGVVLSNGLVADTPAPASALNLPSTNTSVGGTPEFNSYGPANITNFISSNDVARLEVNFTLAAPSAVKFNFIFGSIEYPNFVNSFTDAFLVFLDGVGAANQITYDALNNPVQVGSSFASQLTTADQNSAFANPHGLLDELTTVTGLLSAGSHTLLFEVGDVNDHILDSAAFISNLMVCKPEAQGGCTQGTTPTVPEPASLALVGLGLVGLATARRKKNSV